MRTWLASEQDKSSNSSRESRLSTKESEAAPIALTSALAPALLKSAKDYEFSRVDPGI
jgi:hypothetical protein